ncbi:alpha/beta fold hydrolase [Lolliginicoccus levis]|uniref:alpha/beta fold hydrolase n=1 Tax=Lolliginicoccus levis TaxID=2919542 RepID=UPI0024200742|nr:alpha/beta fold hydrolase [Lolliginicoccus levis]
MKPRREVLLGVRGGVLSGLLAEPDGPSRGMVVALHGAAMSAAYFDAAGHDRSLLDAAARRGLSVLALDRPGYGASRACFPVGLGVLGQSDVVAEALHGLLGRASAGLAVYGHSFGGKVALALAARHPDLGVRRLETCGVGERYAVPVEMVTHHNARSAMHLHWGPVRNYPSGTFLHAARNITQPFPAAERADVPRWHRTLADVAPGVTCPVHFSFAEHEGWWACTPYDREQLRRRFPQALVEDSFLAGAGHNVSLGLAARAHHEAVLDRVLASCGPPTR